MLESFARSHSEGQTDGHVDSMTEGAQGGNSMKTDTGRRKKKNPETKKSKKIPEWFGHTIRGNFLFSLRCCDHSAQTNKEIKVEIIKIRDKIGDLKKHHSPILNHHLVILSPIGDFHF